MGTIIIDIGYISHKGWLDTKTNDQVLAAEPLIELYEVEKKIKPPQVKFFQLDAIAISDYDGNIDIAYNLDESFDQASTHGHICSSGQYKKKVKCLALNTWISNYKNYGFTERIDILSIVVNGYAAYPMLNAFDFMVYPEVISIGQHEYHNELIELLKKHNYIVSRHGSTITAHQR